MQRHGVDAVPWLLVIALFIATAASLDGFLTKPSILSVLVISALLGLASLGQTLTIMLGGIDLSIPGLMTMGNIVSIMLAQHGWPFLTIVLTISAVAIAIGTLNAILSRALQVHPLVVTLAVGLIVAGAVLTITHGGSVNGALPEWVVSAISPVEHTWFIPLPGVLVAWIAVSALVLWGQRGTRFGRLLYAIGSNPLAARLSLAPETVVWVGVYQISALMAALSGILLAAYSGSASVSVSQPYLFMTVAAVVVGGTSLLGGSGGYGRTILGVFVVQLLTVFLLGQGFSTYVQGTILGAMIVLLVSIYGRDQHVSRRI
ncbi:MAG TPA: ABC transporter permease [Solirubrobacteraceae bacterium]